MTTSRSQVINNSTNSILEMIKKRYKGWLKLDQSQNLIQFNELEHRYSLNNKQNDISVTGILSKWFPFDSQTVSLKCVRSKKYSKCVVLDESTGEVDYDKSAANIRKDWANRAAAGTILHKQLELYLSTKLENRGEELIILEGLLTELEEYLDSKGFALYQSKVKLFMEDAYEDTPLENVMTEGEGVKKSLLTVAGSIDALYRNDHGEAVIVDWKRSTARFDFFNNRAVGPMSKYPNTNYWKYAAQLNLYALLLKKEYNIPTVYKILVFFEDDDLNTPPKIFHVPEMPELDSLIKNK